MTHIIDEVAVCKTTCEKTAKSESPTRGHESKCRQTNRDAQRAIPSRIVDAPRRCFFRSLSIKELALNSDFKVVNVLVLNSRWLWGERGIAFVRVGIRNVRAHAQVGPRKNARAPSQARRHAGSVYLLRELAVPSHRSIIPSSGNDAPKVVPDESSP